MAKRGGKRPGAGRKVSQATLETQELRKRFVALLEENFDLVSRKLLRAIKSKKSSDWRWGIEQIIHNGLGRPSVAVDMPDSGSGELVIRWGIREDKS